MKLPRRLTGRITSMKKLLLFIEILSQLNECVVNWTGLDIVFYCFGVNITNHVSMVMRYEAGICGVNLTY